MITQLPNIPEYHFVCTESTIFVLHHIPKDLKKITLILKEKSTCTFVLATTEPTSLNLNVILQEPNSHFTGLFGFMLNNNTHVQLTTQQLHTAPATTSTILVKSLLRDASQSSYTGTIRITQDGIGANAEQNSYALLLSSEARAYAHPSLEVLTHDVQCAHGAAVDTFDAEHLFYVQSRGLSDTQAEKLITQSFFAEFAKFHSCLKNFSCF